jgi:hypothetical protein
MAKLSARLSKEAHAFLKRIAVDKFERKLGRAQIAVIEAALEVASRDYEKHPIAASGDEVTSVTADSDLTKRVDATINMFGKVKRTEATQELMEIGLSVWMARYDAEAEDGGSAPSPMPEAKSDAKRSKT